MFNISVWRTDEGGVWVVRGDVAVGTRWREHKVRERSVKRWKNEGSQDLLTFLLCERRLGCTSLCKASVVADVFNISPASCYMWYSSVSVTNSITIPLRMRVQNSVESKRRIKRVKERENRVSRPAEIAVWSDSNILLSSLLLSTEFGMNATTGRSRWPLSNGQNGQSVVICCTDDLNVLPATLSFWKNEFQDHIDQTYNRSVFWGGLFCIFAILVNV